MYLSLIKENIKQTFASAKQELKSKPAGTVQIEDERDSRSNGSKKAIIINVRIFTPRGIIWEGSAQSVVLPGSDGEMMILRGHIPLITRLKIGILRIRVNWQLLLILFILEGFAQVEGDEVVVLVNAAEWSHQIDIQLAQTAVAAAEASLKQSQTKTEIVQAKKAVKVAQTRLKVAQKFPLVDKS